jgi:hypothetical protein
MLAVLQNVKKKRYADTRPALSHLFLGFSSYLVHFLVVDPICALYYYIKVALFSNIDFALPFEERSFDDK